MAGPDVKTYLMTRYHYDKKDGKWKVLDKVPFATRAKTPKGVAKAAVKITPHINECTDIIFYVGLLFHDRKRLVHGFWCPLTDDYGKCWSDEPQEIRTYIEMRDSCKKTVEDRNHGL